MLSSDAWKSLMARHQQQTLPHALLLNNAEFAYDLAKTVLCFAGQERGCGTCHGCRLLHAKTHPDLLEVSAPKIDEIREIIEPIQKTSQIGQWKVLIIDLADQMNTAASNALLKTLEEPPARVLIILLAQQPRRLLATIRSRCQQICFSVSSPEIHPPEELALLFKNVLTGRERLFQPKEQEDILKVLIFWVMDLIRLKFGQPIISDFLQEINSHVTLAQLFTYLDRLYEAQRYKIEKLNVNTDLLYETLFI